MSSQAPKTIQPQRGERDVRITDQRGCSIIMTVYDADSDGEALACVRRIFDDVRKATVKVIQFRAS